MKKVLIGLLVCLVSVVLVAADKVDPVQTALRSAQALYVQQDYPGAQVALEKWIKDNPGATDDLTASAKFFLSCALQRQNKAAEGQALLEAMLTDYTDINTLVNVQWRIGNMLAAQGKNVDAQSSYEKAIKTYPSANAQMIAIVQNSLGDILAIQGKQPEANVAYMNYVQNNVWRVGASNEQSQVWVIFNRINPKLATVDEYKTFLENTIKATKATEDNAKFLGRLKSELEKMK